MVLDEVQRARDLLIAVKRAVDSDPRRTPGRFVLTGSANLLMLARLGETLAGRVVYVNLWPFTRRERLGMGRTGLWSELLQTPFRDWRDVITSLCGPEEDWRRSVQLGGFPVPSPPGRGVRHHAPACPTSVEPGTSLPEHRLGQDPDLSDQGHHQDPHQPPEPASQLGVHGRHLAAQLVLHRADLVAELRLHVVDPVVELGLHLVNPAS